jgi:hypothetical protein
MTRTGPFAATDIPVSGPSRATRCALPVTENRLGCSGVRMDGGTRTRIVDGAVTGTVVDGNVKGW